MVAHPLTTREVGNIPKDWFDKAQNKSEAGAKIYKAINTFQKNKNLENFSDNLTEILNKKAKVEKISQGGVRLTEEIHKVFYEMHGGFF